jgi:hypothetical protein
MRKAVWCRNYWCQGNATVHSYTAPTENCHNVVIILWSGNTSHHIVHHYYTSYVCLLCLKKLCIHIFMQHFSNDITTLINYICKCTTFLGRIDNYDTFTMVNGRHYRLIRLLSLTVNTVLIAIIPSQDPPSRAKTVKVVSFSCARLCLIALVNRRALLSLCPWYRTCRAYMYMSYERSGALVGSHELILL